MRYIKKVHVFTADSAKQLETDVNAFLSKEIDCGFTVVDIQYQAACTHISATQPILIVYTCMLYYSEPVEE